MDPTTTQELPMIAGYGMVLAFMVTGIMFLVGPLLIQRFLAPRKYSAEKSIPYECGEDPIGTPWVQFNIRFYVFALIFLIFDVEVAFLLPWAVAFRSPEIAASYGALAFWDGVLFVGILVIGFAYLWSRGDLKWIRPTPRFSKDEKVTLDERTRKEREILLGKAV